MKTLNLKMLEVRLNEYLHCIYIQDQLHFLSLLFDRSNFKRFLVVASSYIFTIFCRFVCLSIVPKLTISVAEVSLGYCISLVYTPYTPNLFCDKQKCYVSHAVGFPISPYFPKFPSSEQSKYFAKNKNKTSKE